MIVGVDDAVADFVAQQFRGAVGDHLVGVHIRGGARAGLEDIDRELVVVLAGDDLVCGVDDCTGGLRIEKVKIVVCLRGGLLDDAECANEASAEADTRDGEVLDCPLGLGTPVGVGRDLHLAETVRFRAVILAHTEANGRIRGKSY